ncbi:MAG: hypothetical protein COY66_00095 [Candidatus Kerfeldbacteria bacterium CG_4_10_14_0_8_um_filter_42_10]|uniref:Glycosyltransferase RgtA/B/C/D-like domain-containing protein n=1 Tax=Candidatus Kerfeldbacteria bacterium CG_4_10_14_0_8_um_filter_42_10 TaxID=2014248 RepID=A0A2M7RKQ7_9BACT|nr:MAG: hypothetical protein COY66_00095 [Candidatus Kerfeldbacteria bacterium CG_4_10_14_0_8_um_filter_42_10]
MIKKGSWFSKFSIIIPVAALLGVMLLLEFTSALQESQTVDEGAHLSSGYSYLKTGDFRMNPEHPPLLKEISAFPLLFLNLDDPINHESWNTYNQWDFGRNFLYHNRADADLILLMGRIPVMLLSLILGIFIFKWAKQLWGNTAALFSLTLYVFEPNILAHSRYVTTDLALTLFLFLTIYALDRYLQTYSRKDLIILAVLFALAQVTKFSAVILFPILIVLLLLKKFHSPPGKLTYRKISLITAFVVLITGAAILLAYGFQTKRPIDDRNIKEYFEKQSAVTDLSDYSDEPFLARKLLTFTNPSTASGKIIYELAQKIPVPAFYYFRGLGLLIAHDFWGHLSYLFGRYSDFGFWYYFPSTFLLKTSAPLLLLFFSGICLFSAKLLKTVFCSDNESPSKIDIIKKRPLLKLKNRIQKKLNNFAIFFRKIPFTYWLLILTPLAYFLWALTSKINIGHRHILPIYPFIIILVGSLVTIKTRWRKTGKIFLTVLLTLYVASTIRIYPNFLAYFNELVGGPQKGPKYLVDSNIDWGQDILKLKHYLEKNDIAEVYLGFLGSLDINYYNFNRKAIPKDKDKNQIRDFNGVVAISVTVLYEQDRSYAWIERLEPDAKIGYSIYVYDLRKNKISL